VALKLGIEVQLQLGQFKPSSLVAAALAAAPKVNLLQLPQPAATAVLMKQPMADLATYIQADCIRLVHLKGWMKKYSNQVDTLKISSHSRYAKGMDYWQRQLLASGLASVVQGLAAGRAAQGRLRLTTLDLEVSAAWAVCQCGDNFCVMLVLGLICMMHVLCCSNPHPPCCKWQANPTRAKGLLPVWCSRLPSCLPDHTVCLHLLLVAAQVLSFTQLQDTMDTLSACKRLRRLQLTGPSILHT
jgi:hypothetical protein